MAILSLFVRQNNIIWLVLSVILIYIREYPLAFKISWIKSYIAKALFHPSTSPDAVGTVQGLGRFFSVGSLHFLGILLFIIFVIINRGVSFAQSDMHPTNIGYLGNLYFLLFSFFILFIPLSAANFSSVVGLINKRKYIIPYIITGCFIYIFTFVNNHPYNQIRLFIRNEILILVTNDIVLKIIFYIFIIYGLLSLAVEKLMNPKYYLIYPFSILSLLSVWLIEPRYYFVPFALFILFRKPKSKPAEYALLSYFIILSLLIFRGTIMGEFFI